MKTKKEERIGAKAYRRQPQCVIISTFFHKKLNSSTEWRITGKHDLNDGRSERK